MWRWQIYQEEEEGGEKEEGEEGGEKEVGRRDVCVCLCVCVCARARLCVYTEEVK